MPAGRVVFEDFSGGEFGSIGAEGAARVIPNGFHALNMQVYRDTSIGPRAGLFNLAPTGLGNGVVHGFGWRGTSGADLWYAQGTALKLLDASAAGNAVQSVTNALASTPTRPLASFEGESPYTYIANYGDKGYRLNHSTDTLTALTGSPAAGTICIYGERYMMGGTSALPNRLYYSAEADPNSWPAANFIDVGDGMAEIVGLFPQRGHLAILKNDGSWWVLTGVPGVNDTLRRVTGGRQHPWSLAEPAAYMLGDDRVAFLPLSAGWPGTFDGARVTEQRHLDFLGNLEVTHASGTTALARVVKGFKPEEYAFFGGSGSGFDFKGKALLYRMGVHTFHDFDKDIQSFAASDGQGRIFLTDGGAAGANPAFYIWKLNLDRPGFTSDQFAEPGDDSTSSAFNAYLELPEVEAPAGTEIAPRAVTVEFTKWQHGGSFTNNITVGIDAWDRYEGSGVVSATTQSFNESQASASTSGTKQRATFSYAMDPFAACQVKLSAIRGCSIRRVVFDFETVPWRGRP